MEYLVQHVPSIVAPRALGFVTFGKTSCMFMTRLPGETLKDRWPSMSEREKHAVRATLNAMLTDLRRVELPAGSPLGSLSERHACKDTRRDLRFSAGPIYCEEHFNAFINSSKTSRASAGYRQWVSSLMRNDHRILLTHGDLHPGNIIVDTNADDDMTMGIVDWEMGEFYPEYWEQLKALNLRAIDDTSDWWDFLPEVILGYDHKVVIDRLIENTLL